MGVLDRLKGKPRTLSARGGLILAAITMSAVDGDIDDDEVAVIHRLDGKGRTAAWDEAIAVWKANSIEECIPLVVSVLDARQQLLTLANLVDIAMADGILGTSEQALLQVYVDAFDVSDEDLELIVKITEMKNDQSIFDE